VPKIEYSPKSKQDLEEIGDYIALTLKNPIAALNTVNKIQDRIDKLAKLPTIGIRLSTIADVDSDYRLLVCGNYIAFFHGDESSIYIDRILYGRRDYLSILFPNLPKDDEE
jgi:plasmid stabilization system protein ParE